VSLFILSLLLTALLRLELVSFVVSARDTEVLESLVPSVERLDELIRLKFQGEEKKIYENYSMSAAVERVTGGMPADRLKVEIYDNENRSIGDLSVYRLRSDASLGEFLQGTGLDMNAGSSQGTPGGFLGSPPPGLEGEIVPTPTGDLMRELLERAGGR
jgi:hypothetical protein